MSNQKDPDLSRETVPFKYLDTYFTGGGPSASPVWGVALRMMSNLECGIQSLMSPKLRYNLSS